MIRDLGASLRALLDDPGLATQFADLEAAEIVFDRPSDTFAPANSSVDLFLYDIRENLDLRNNEPIVERNNGTATIRQPPRRIDCSYLVTAWPVGGADLALQEHRLLAQALTVLGRHPTIPPAFLQGSLAGQEPPLPMIAPQIDGLKSPADFWTAMGNQIRASFTVTATISVPLYPDVTSPVVTSIHTGYDPGEAIFEETRFQVGGRVFGPLSNPVSKATVDVLGPQLRAETDVQGQFTFANIPAGNHTFRVVAVGFQVFTANVTVPESAQDLRFTLIPL